MTRKPQLAGLEKGQNGFLGIAKQLGKRPTWTGESKLNENCK
jgi:hypothetical protein